MLQTRRGAAVARLQIPFLNSFHIDAQKLAPKWNGLAEKLTGVKDLVIAKIDGTANEVSGLTIQSYPTFMFFPKGKDGTVPARIHTTPRHTRSSSTTAAGAPWPTLPSTSRSGSDVVLLVVTRAVQDRRQH